MADRNRPLTSAGRHNQKESSQTSRFAARSSYLFRSGIQAGEFPVSKGAVFVHNDDLDARIKRPITCPNSWVRKTTNQDWTQDYGCMPNLDQEEKKNLTRDFVERNGKRLWMYDTSYLRKNPDTVMQQIECLEDNKFVPLMRKMHDRERVFALSSSENFRKSYKDDHLPTARGRRLDHDPFIMTLDTSRQNRTEKMNSLLKASAADVEIRHRRGDRHNPDYHNFSNFSSFLKSNANSIINR